MSYNPPISTSLRYRDAVSVVTVGGEIDLATAPVVEGAIDQALAGQPEALVIDLSSVTFLSSTGLRMLIETQHVVAGKARLAVVADSPATSRPILLMQLNTVIDVYPTLDEAVRAVRPAPAA
jgi:anti-sigma B factor antagonist